MNDAKYIVLRKDVCDRCDGTGRELNGATCHRCMGNKALFEKVDLTTALIDVGIYERIMEIERTAAAMKTRLEVAERNAQYASNYADYAQGISRE